VNKTARAIAFLAAGIVVLWPLAACAFEGSLNEAPIDSVYRVEGRKDLFRSTNFYFGGQPNLETLRWLKTQGVTTIINLRSEKENKDFAETAFDEASIAGELGMSYASIPLGDKSSYRPQAVDTFAQVLASHGGKAFIHCLSAGRATYLWMAYLVRHRGMSLDDAAMIGRRMKYSTTLEDLLGAKISLTIVK
jgi:protein tyrosine phosphatase (PTP) superfamily phosphohydrolase (DUF442 family)